MRFLGLVALVTIASASLAGCGEGGTAPPPTPLEIEGKWLYLGPAPSNGHYLTIGKDSMVYTDVDGKWSSTWTIKATDNALNHFQMVFASGNGTYIPVGPSMSGAYDDTGQILTIQLSNGLASYPPLQNAGTCTDMISGAATPDCRLYIKQN
jgi:hypothetical protein